MAKKSIRHIYGESKLFTHSDISAISQKLDWNWLDTFDFVLQLLEDVNAHQAMAKVEEILSGELKKFNESLEKDIYKYGTRDEVEFLKENYEEYIPKEE